MRLNVERAANVVMRTTPYLGHRALVFGILMAAAVVHIFVLGLVGWFFGAGAYWALVIGSALLIGWTIRVGGLFDFGPAQKVDLGHIALMAEIVSQGDGPLGASQAPWATERVSARFPDTADRAEIGCRLMQAMYGINECVLGTRRFPPLPGMRVLRTAVLARIFDSNEPNTWEAARRALLLYAQTIKSMCVMATAIEAAKLGATLVILFACMVVPFGPIARLAPEHWELFRFSLFLLAMLVAWGIKAVIIDPLAMAAVIQRFFLETDGLELDAKLEAELEARARGFSDIQRLARGRAGS